MSERARETLRLIVVSAIISGPFYLLAGDIDDGTELRASIIGGAAVAMLIVVQGLWRRWNEQRVKRKHVLED